MKIEIKKYVSGNEAAFCHITTISRNKHRQNAGVGGHLNAALEGITLAQAKSHTPELPFVVGRPTYFGSIWGAYDFPETWELSQPSLEDGGLVHWKTVFQKTSLMGAGRLGAKLRKTQGHSLQNKLNVKGSWEIILLK